MLFLPVRRGDVLAAWSGIRPLVLNPAANDTQSVARNHIIDVSPNKLVTIAGKVLYKNAYLCRPAFSLNTHSVKMPNI